MTLCLFAMPPLVHGACWDTEGYQKIYLSKDSFVVGTRLNPHRSQLMDKDTENEKVPAALSINVA